MSPNIFSKHEQPYSYGLLYRKYIYPIHKDKYGLDRLYENRVGHQALLDCTAIDSFWTKHINILREIIKVGSGLCATCLYHQANFSTVTASHSVKYTKMSENIHLF